MYQIGDALQMNGNARRSEREAQKRHRRSRTGRRAGRRQRARQGRQRDRQSCAPCPSGRWPWAEKVEKAAESELTESEMPGEHCDGAATSPGGQRFCYWSVTRSTTRVASHTNTFVLEMVEKMG